MYLVIINIHSSRLLLPAISDIYVFVFLYLWRASVDTLRPEFAKNIDISPGVTLVQNLPARKVSLSHVFLFQGAIL